MVEAKHSASSHDNAEAPSTEHTLSQTAYITGKHPRKYPYMQNRELSWLTFNKRCLDQGADASVPLLERLQFVSIFWSNLQEFFMVRVGSLTDLSLVNKELLDTKAYMSPQEQIDAIHDRCHELSVQEEEIYHDIESGLAEAGVHRITAKNLDDAQLEYVHAFFDDQILPYLSPQIINARHPFPHLENGALYVIVRLNEKKKNKSEMTKSERREAKEERRKAKNLGADGVTLGLIPMPRQCRRVIQLPGDGFTYILLEDVIEMMCGAVFDMYSIKHTNVICITRNADIDANESADEDDVDYREFMKRILKKRARLAPVRLQSRRGLSETVAGFLLPRLGLSQRQTYVTSVPLDLGYVFGLSGMVGKDLASKLTSTPFSPQWPACIDRNRRVIDQVSEEDKLISYPYESMDAFVKLLQEAAADPDVISIKITLYRLASQSHLAEALIAAAEAGKEVTALFELRARFDEQNNIDWSQRFEEAGANVIYGFREYKVHSKICCITRKKGDGLERITQLGTGNYNEKTAKLYTDLCYITTDEQIGRDAIEFFNNMSLENLSDEYKSLRVAPLQIKQAILAKIDEQIEVAKSGGDARLFFKTNSVTDSDIIQAISKASQAGVPVTMLVRGISCIVPGVEGYTDNVRVVSIVGRLLEHSRIFCFGTGDDATAHLSSADLMTRNMDKRVEIAWPVTGEIKRQVLEYVDTCLEDTAKLRELTSDGTYTPLRYFANTKSGGVPFNSQEFLMSEAIKHRNDANVREAEEAAKAREEQFAMHAQGKAQEVTDIASSAAREAASKATEAVQEAAEQAASKATAAAEAATKMAKETMDQLLEARKAIEEEIDLLRKTRKDEQTLLDNLRAEARELTKGIQGSTDTSDKNRQGELSGQGSLVQESQQDQDQGAQAPQDSQDSQTTQPAHAAPNAPLNPNVPAGPATPSAAQDEMDIRPMHVEGGSSYTPPTRTSQQGGIRGFFARLFRRNQ